MQTVRTLSIAVAVSFLAGGPLAGQGFGDVEVTPDGYASGTKQASTSGHVAQFTVTNTGMDPDIFSLSCSGTLGITCSVQSTVSLDPNETDYINVTFSTGSSTGTGTVSLEAFGFDYGGQDTGSRTYTVVAGNPIQITRLSVPSGLLQLTTDTAVWRVKDIGSTPATFQMSCDWGGEACQTSPSSKYLTAGAQQDVQVIVDAGAFTGSFPLEFESTTGSYAGDDSLNVSVTDFLFVNSVAVRNPIYGQPNTNRVDTFAIQAPGQPSATYNLSIACSGVTNCSVLGGATRSIGDSPVKVAVQHRPGSNGTSGTVTLTATHPTYSSVSASGSFAVEASSSIRVSIADANAGLEEIRGDCPNVRAGAGAIVCDDFYYVYPFLPVTALNKTRQIGLIYNSSFRKNQGPTAADVVLPPGVTEPSSLTYSVMVDGIAFTGMAYGQSLYSPGVPTRFSSYWEGSGVSSGPKVLPVIASVAPQGGATVSDTAYVLSPHHQERFGRGWWLAGYENLAVQSVPALGGTVLLWTGGDTSVRLYLPHPTLSNTWTAATRTRSDTITSSGGNYTRHLIGGGEVQYTSTGLHSKTVDRNGNETVFSHITINGIAKPYRIWVPTQSGGSSIAFEITYNGSTGGITGVKAPNATMGWDTYTVHTTGTNVFTVDSIVAPDGLRTRFGQEWGLLTDITGPAGDSTHVDYYSAQVLKVTAAAPGETPIVVDYSASSTIGLATASFRAPQPTAMVRSEINGPRTDSSDVTKFYVTGWGAVRGIEDPYGNQTWIDREDPTYPGLPTRVRSPNGHEVLAEYRTDGLLDYTVDRSTGAKTEYGWNTTWSAPSQVTSPEGISTTFTYDSGGNLKTESSGGRTVTYDYNGDGTVKWVRDPMLHYTYLYYDSKGNLREENPPGDGWTRYARDQAGRVVKTVAPISASDSTIAEIYHDLVGRDTLTLMSSSADSKWRKIRREYEDGLLKKVEPLGSDSDGTGTLGTSNSTWLYDGFGRVIRNESGDSLLYSTAGLVAAVVTPKNDTITYKYDLLGRVTRRIVTGRYYAPKLGIITDFPYGAPSGLTISADTATYSYDAMGNLVEADNAFVRITRTYSANGNLKSDEARMRKYSNPSDWSTHVYTITHAYDLDGRRIGTGHPAFLSPGSDLTRYRYRDDGLLDEVEGPLSSMVVSYGYDGHGYVDTRVFPGNVTESMSLDAAHRVATRTVLTTTTDFIADTLAYDHRHKVTAAPQASMEYDGLGQLDYARFFAPRLDDEDWYSVDGLGQARQTESYDLRGPATWDLRKTVNHTFQFGRNIWSQEEWNTLNGSQPATWEPSIVNRLYDANGDLYWVSSTDYTWQTNAQTFVLEPKVEWSEESHYYYSGNGELRYAQVNRDSLRLNFNWGKRSGAWEEYWYDALGRRVLKRSLQDSGVCGSGNWSRCYTSTERAIWDGSQLLWETRQSGTDAQAPSGGEQTGIIGYVHAGGIDAPVMVVRNGQAVFPHTNWRGSFATGSDSQGDQVGCYPQSFSGCEDIAWPAEEAGAWRDTDRTEFPDWYGSVIVDHRDATGLLYRRNRYYSPDIGQFTQRDPIGIAGGLNLYGYAHGDPINFSDPLGLDECDDIEDEKERDKCEQEAAQQAEEASAGEADGGEGNEGLQLGRCSWSSFTFSFYVVSDLSLVSGSLKLVNATAKAGSAMTTHLVNSMLGTAGRGQLVLARNGLMVQEGGEFITRTAEGTVAVGGVSASSGFSWGDLVPFRGHGERSDAVATNCAAFSAWVLGGE